MFRYLDAKNRAIGISLRPFDSLDGIKPPYNVNTYSQQKAMESIGNPAETARKLAVIHSEKEKMRKALEQLPGAALLTTALAAEGIGVNPVAAFYHDHLFVPEDRAEDALAILRRLAAGPG